MGLSLTFEINLPLLIWLLLLPLGYSGDIGDYVLCLQIWGILIIGFKLGDLGYPPIVLIIFPFIID